MKGFIAMKINYNVQGKERKSLVNIIAETINTEAEYQKAPTYSYIIGNFTVTRDGAIETYDEFADEDEINAVIAALSEAGFEGEQSEDEGDILPDNAEVKDEAEDSPQAENEGENGADLGDNEGGVFTISYPLGGFNPDTLDMLLVCGKMGTLNLCINLEQ